MPMDNPKKDQNMNSNLFDYDENDLNDLNGEWSFNLGGSFIATEVSNNESDMTVQQENTIMVDKELYEELVATCDALRNQMKDLEDIVDKKHEEEQEVQLKMNSLKLECEGVKKEKNELFERFERKEEEAASTFYNLQMKINDLTTESQKKTEELEQMKKKYNNLKKHGLQMLEQRDKDINKMQKDMAEQKEKLEAIQLVAISEKEKRQKYENEMETANRMIKDALLKEKISRKQVEKKCLKEKTENMALQEKVNDMSSRGVIVLKECPVVEHDLLAHRIDVLQRQRDILVDSINQRESTEYRK